VEREQRVRPAVRVRRGEWNSGVPSASEVSTLWRDTQTHTHQFNGPFSGTTRVSRYQKGNTDLDFTEVRGDSEWQWHLLDHMQVCTSLKTDNHTSTPPLSFYRPDALLAAQPTASKHRRPYGAIQIRLFCYHYIGRSIFSALFARGQRRVGEGRQ